MGLMMAQEQIVESLYRKTILGYHRCFCNSPCQLLKVTLDCSSLCQFMKDHSGSQQVFGQLSMLVHGGPLWITAGVLVALHASSWRTILGHSRCLVSSPCQFKEDHSGSQQVFGQLSMLVHGGPFWVTAGVHEVLSISSRRTILGHHRCSCSYPCYILETICASQSLYRNTILGHIMCSGNSPCHTQDTIYSNQSLSTG